MKRASSASDPEVGGNAETPESLGVAVLTVSDTRTLETDRSGVAICELLEAAGHRVLDRRIVTDDVEAIRGVLRRWMDDDGIQAMLVTGGTGITERDVTPEAIAPLVTKPIPGFGELFRWLSYADIGAATIQSRADAGLCGRTLLFSLPGSPGAVRLALEKIILPQLDSRTRPCNFPRLFPRLGKAGESQ
ncbi:MAG: molybdenum cofactor biosynthesis protein B [Myxococcales bacterium]|jgi:molybdenum cofactor biosynthesis protein B|nr:molybdenum cofactor biosynthesis protein B [Myxococcales bacterium]